MTLQNHDDNPLILKLILAQLVNENGVDSFRKVVDQLDKHPMLANIPQRKMTITVCCVHFFYRYQLLLI